MSKRTAQFSQCDSHPSTERVRKWISEGSLDTKTDSASLFHDSDFISALYRANYDFFHLLTVSEHHKGIRSRSLQNSLSGCLERFYLWSQGLEFAELEASSDVAQEVHKHILTLLWRVGRALCKILDNESQHEDRQCSGYPADSLKEARDATNKYLEDAGNIVPELKDEGGGEQDEESIYTDSGSEVETNHSLVVDGKYDISELELHVTGLMDLLPSVQHMLNNQRQSQAAFGQVMPTEIVHVMEAAKPYVRQIRDKFQGIDTCFAERLGEANWQRFVRVRQKMSEIATAGVASYLCLEADRSKIEHEVPVSTFLPASKFQDSGLGTSVPAKSQFGGSVASHTSFLSTATDFEKGTYRVPDTPLEVTDGKPFTCFICGQCITRVENRQEWKMHVFDDLQAYICTFDGCKNKLITFSSRKMWADHEFTQHRVHHSFTCSSCAATLSDEYEFHKHMTDVHGITLTGARLLIALSSAKVNTPQDVVTLLCPFCHRKDFNARRLFVAHVARHMEGVALSVLPRDVESDVESEAAYEGDLAEQAQNLTRSDSEESIQVSDTTSSPALNTKYSVTRMRDGTSEYLCAYPGCCKSFRRRCELRKHENGHTHPWACTFDGCHKPIGSKNDWMRHEVKVHMQRECWRCEEVQSNISGNSVQTSDNDACMRLFTTKKEYLGHLQDQHRISQPDIVGRLCRTQHIGAKFSGQYWCGFCNKIVVMKDIGLKGVSERFNHIDHHFTREVRRMAQWRPLNGRPASTDLAASPESDTGQSSNDDEETDVNVTALVDYWWDTAAEQDIENGPASVTASGDQGMASKLGQSAGNVYTDHVNQSQQIPTSLACKFEGCGHKSRTYLDLKRHQNTVHAIQLVRWNCFGLDCTRREWPRKDHFERHLKGMHPHEDFEMLMRKSNEWYELLKKPLAESEDHAARDP